MFNIVMTDTIVAIVVFILFAMFIQICVLVKENKELKNENLEYKRMVRRMEYQGLHK